MFQNKSFYVRVILTMFLCYGVFTETGYFTAASMFLIFIAMELISYWMGQVNETLKGLNNII